MTKIGTRKPCQFGAKSIPIQAKSRPKHANLKANFTPGAGPSGPMVKDGFATDVLRFKLRRGSQAVRQRSAKPLFGGSIPPRASNNFRASPVLVQIKEYREPKRPKCQPS